MSKQNKPWVDELLDSLENSRPASPDDAFVQRMELLAEDFVSKPKRINRATLFALAASLALLIVANVVLVRQAQNYTAYEQVSTEEESGANYLLIPTKTINYE